MGLQNMGRPVDKHLDEQELDPLVPWLPENKPHRPRLSTHAVREAERHLESCPACSKKVGEYRQLVHRPAVPPPVSDPTQGTACSVGQDVDWYEVAAGLWPEGKASQLITHAALCDHCGPLLRAATSANDEPTPEEETWLSELKAPSRPVANSGRGPIAPTRLPSPGWRQLLQFKIFVPAVALLLLVGVFAKRSPSSQTPLSGPQFAEFAVDAHRKHAEGTLALDVHSESEQALNEFFKSKSQISLALPASPALPGEERPYRVEGARLLRVRGTAAAYIAYRMQSGLVSLIVAPDSLAVASGGVGVNFSKVSFHYSTVQGYKAVTWSVHGLTYALISQEGNLTQKSCMVCHSAMKDRDLTQTPTPLPVDRSVLQPVWQ